MRISSFVTTCLWIGYCWSVFAVGSINYFHESSRFETTTEYVDTSILSSSTSRDVDISTFRERDDLRYRNHVVDQRVLQRASPTTPLRIDCGSTKNWTDASGNLWLSDRYFVNGWTRSDRCPTNVSGTTLDTIYCSARFWQGTNNAIVTVYNIPASDGNYQVTLRFAELYVSSVNARKLGIIVDGTQITTSPLDLFASVGRDMAYDVTVPVNVKSALTGNGIGNIKIQFLGYGSNIILNAIDVVPIMVSLPVTTPVSMPVTAPVSVPIPVAPQPIATPVVPISPVSIPKPVPALVPVSTVAPTNVPISLPTTKVPTTKVQSSLSPTNAPVPVKVPVTSAPIIGVQPVIRINVGSDVTWTDKDTGFVWSADKYNYGFSGAFSGCSSNISGTDLDPVFCDYRSFFGPNGTVAGYNIPVPKPGLYTVNLYFAEVFFEDEGQRVFQVAVQGKVLAPLLDVFSLVGMNAAYVLNTVATVQVASAGINIELTTRVENAILNGIEILDGVHTPAPVTAPPPTPAKPIRINAGSNTEWLDENTGYKWIADKFFKGGWMYSNGIKSINGTEQDTIYSSHRSGGGYSILVPPGQYTVTLMFAEIYFSDKDKRVFKVSVQGKLLKPSLDVVAEAGPDNAYTISTTVDVGASGKIDITLTAITENTMISGIEIIPDSGPVPIPIAPPVVPISPLSTPKPVVIPIFNAAPTMAPAFLPTKAPAPIKVSVTAAPVLVPKPVTPAPVIGVQPAIRINVGSDTPWTDTATGFIWLADTYSYGFSGTFSDCSSNMSGTDLDPVFCDYRAFFGPNGTVSGYNIPVSKPGLYTVKLYFAEVYFFEEDKRVFQVAVQGKVLAPLLDVFSLVGEDTAYVLTAVATVQLPSASINIELTNRVEHAIVNGIEILDGVHTPAPVSAPPPIVTPIRINAGSNAEWIDDTTGYTWIADKFFKGGWMYGSGLKSIGGTEQDTVYSSHRAGGGYSILVPPGQYTVILMFAEIYFEQKDSRIFTVSVQGQVVKSSLDVVAEAGPNNAYRISTIVVVGSTGKIDISLTALKENTMISGIEIIPGATTFSPSSAPVFAPFKPIRINAGGPAWVDPITQFEWAADQYFDKGGGFSIDPSLIKGTSKNVLFASHRSFGGGFSSLGTYTIPVQQGLYTVNLMFAETFWTGIKDRLFDVIVQGNVVAKNLDLIEVAGEKTAYTLSTVATVTPVSQVNYIIIQMSNIINNGLISAIEILQYTPPPTSAPPTIPPIRINCGYNAPFEDAQGAIWAPDSNYTSGQTYSKVVADIFNTTDDLLYFYERAGDPIVYNFSVNAGVYKVTLFFAETLFTKIGDRVMDIQVGDKVQKNYDILAVASKLAATKLVFYSIADNGFLSIQLSKAASAISSAVPKVNAIEIILDAPHLAHSVARGPYFGTVSDGSGKAKISLEGETSHTHGPGLLITNAEWKQGNQTLGNYLNLDYNFPVGNHTISLSIKDSGGNQNTEVTTVSIRPFGFPTITDITPKTGSIYGNFDVTIKGAGFTDSALSTTVVFGLTELTGSSVQIIDQYTIKVSCPPTKIGQRVSVYVQTTKGRSEESFFSYFSDVAILWNTGNLFAYVKPTTGRFAHDRKLYVATIEGEIMKVTLNDDFTQVISSVVSRVNPNKEAILGMAFDPMDVKANPDVYFNSNQFFAGGTLSSSGTSISGKIKMASGPNLETVTTIISGLPVSDHDHGLNGMVFGDNGELYFTLGSNTNGGVPGPLSGSKTLKENFLSAAINVAYLSHPNFNGTITWTSPDDGNMIAKGIDVFAAGLRNPFGIEFHSNGKLYSQDNGPNDGYGAYSTDCQGGSIPEFNDHDEFNWIQQGKYYGSPNKKRAEFFNDPRQCKWWSGLAKSNSDLTGALVTSYASRVGLLEFSGDFFAGQLRGNLISVQFGATPSFSRLILNDDGTDVVPQSWKFIPLDIGTESLDVTQAPNGNLIDIRYNTNLVAYYSPIEAAKTQLTVNTVFPHRGPSAGGSILAIYGDNFGATVTGVSVTVGGNSCAVNTVKPTLIECTLPGGSGSVDVKVTIGGKTSTYEKGYRYISGLPKPGFVLPVYDGTKP